jgi:hypothetical protein
MQAKLQTPMESTTFQIMLKVVRDSSNPFVDNIAEDVKDAGPNWLNCLLQCIDLN